MNDAPQGEGRVAVTEVLGELLDADASGEHDAGVVVVELADAFMSQEVGRSGAAARKDAELVPLWVGKYDPALIALADVGVPGT
jgi:hypothetical protein